MKWFLVQGCLVVAAAGCGGATEATEAGAPSPTGSASVTGTINGQPVPANDAVGTQLTTTTNGVTITSRTIGITSVTNACPCAITQGYSTVLVLTVDVRGTALPMGTYRFPSDGMPSGINPVGEAHYVVNNPGTTRTPAASGSITISQISSSTTVGSFDLVFPAGDHVTGTFSAPLCVAAETQRADAAACP